MLDGVEGFMSFTGVEPCRSPNASLESTVVLLYMHRQDRVDTSWRKVAASTPV